MKVNLDNYEAFLLDHLEGNLGKEDTEALMAFLALHPELEVPEELPELLIPGTETLNADFKSGLKYDTAHGEILCYLEGLMSGEEKSRFESRLSSDPVLKAELLAFQKTMLLADENENLQDKSALRKTEDDLFLSDRTIAYHEGLLKDDLKKQFELEILVDEKLAAELRLTAATRLSAETEIIYPDKQGLKKGARIISLFSYRSVSVMAASLTLIAALGIIFSQFKTDAPVLTAGKSPASQRSTASVVSRPANAAQANEAPVVAAVKAVKPVKKQKPVLPATEEKTFVQENLALDKNPRETVSEPSFTNRDSSALASAEHKYNVIKKDSLPNGSTLMMAATDDDFDDFQKSAGKKRWWHRVADLAGQANKAGLKTIDGESHDENKFRFSFSAFSVEKK